MRSLLIATVCVGLAAHADEPTKAAKLMARRIRREALLPPNGRRGRPLPMVSHWNVGTVRGTFEPDHQIALIQAGHHVLPWMAWPRGDPDQEKFKNYHGRLLTYCAKLRIPISFRGTQWDAMLVGREYRSRPDDEWPGTIMPDGTRKNLISPFGPTAPWKDPAATRMAGESKVLV